MQPARLDPWRVKHLEACDQPLAEPPRQPRVPMLEQHRAQRLVGVLETAQQRRAQRALVARLQRERLAESAASVAGRAASALELKQELVVDLAAANLLVILEGGVELGEERPQGARASRTAERRAERERA